MHLQHAQHRSRRGAPGRWNSVRLLALLQAFMPCSSC